MLAIAPAIVYSVEPQKSPNDNREYKYFVLENGLRAIVVSDPDAELAAVALDVDVGSLHNSPDREGLAHFLEHMLFLGTQKYPQPDEYREYIERHGGRNNAFTSLMDTRYYFTIIPDYLPGALDRFSQFFIAPNFDADLVERERNAVHAEYMLKYQNDMLRAYRVDSITSNPEHSYGLFSCGNKDSLGDDPSRPAVREQLIEFYNRYYSAQRMVLAIVGPQSISELEGMVHENFSSIPRRTVANNIIQELAFTPRETGIKLSIKPISETSRLILNFPIPEQFQNYDNNSIEYINFMLGQSAPGGLEHMLREKNWILGMYVGNENITHKQDLLHVSFELTDIGVKRVDEIVEYFYSYVNYLRTQGPQQQIFADLKSAGEREFNFVDKQSAVDLCLALPYVIKHYPVEDILHAGNFVSNTKYSPDKIMHLLDRLTPENMRMIVIDKSVKTNKVEKYYQIDYAVDKFTKHQLQLWDSSASSIGFSLPKANPYLPLNFTLLPATNDVNDKSSSPTQIFTDPGFKVWYMPDFRFKRPKEDINIQFTMPNAQNTPRRALLQKFLVLALSDRLQEQEQLFELAGIAANISNNADGILLSINMFSDRENIFLEEIMRSIEQIKLEPQRFAVYKDHVARDLDSFKFEMSAMQAYEILKSLVLRPHWVATEVLHELPTITLDDLEQYKTEFLQQMQVEVLVHGNLSKDKATRIFNSVRNKLSLNTTREATPSLPKLLQLIDNSNYTYVFAPDHADAAVVSYVQSPQEGDLSIAKNALLTRIMQGPLFEQLRTQEQLAYFVDLMIFRVLERPGMTFIIQSSDKSPQYLQERFSTFVEEFSQKLLSMNKEEYEQYRASLKKILTKQPDSLNEQTARYWDQISNQTYRFGFNQDIANQLDKITLNDLATYLQATWLNGTSPRKVTVASSSVQPYIEGNQIKSIFDFKAEQP